MPEPGVTGRRGIVTGGTWCVDRNRLLPVWPEEDAGCEILSEELQGGGSGCNLAIDVRKLDSEIPVETIGLVGDDRDGQFLIGQADLYSINRAQLVMTAGEVTHYCDAYTSQRSGRRTHIFYSGAGALLTPEHFDMAATTGRILHLGLPGVHRRMDSAWGSDANGWVSVLREARHTGLQTNLELASVAPGLLAPLVLPCLPHLDLLIVNDCEIGEVAETRTAEHGHTDVAACIEAARLVLSRGAMRMVVVHFPRGAIAVTPDGSVHTQPSVAVPPEAIAGANGAGDAFAAGFLYGYHEDWTLEDMLRLAHASAACSLRSLSTTGALEPWRICLERAAGWGFRDEPLAC